MPGLGEEEQRKTTTMEITHVASVQVDLAHTGRVEAKLAEKLFPKKKKDHASRDRLSNSFTCILARDHAGCHLILLNHRKRNRRMYDYATHCLLDVL